MKARTIDPRIALKKHTLTAWTFILLNEGLIDLRRCNAMISAISDLRS